MLKRVNNVDLSSPSSKCARLEPLDDCVICLEPLDKEEICQLTACHHRFHAVCIQPWLYTTPSCPVCRSTYTACNHHDTRGKQDQDDPHSKTVLRRIIQTQQQSTREFQLRERGYTDTILALQQQMIINERGNSLVIAWLEGDMFSARFGR
jgi:hypothetical protein